MMIHLLKKIHADERGAVAVETVLVIAAIAIPVILFMYKIGWPAIREMFETSMDTLINQSESVHSD